MWPPTVSLSGTLSAPGNCRRRTPEGPADQSTRASAGRARRRTLGSPSTHCTEHHSSPEAPSWPTSVDRLADPDARLVTIVGRRGIGKTRLAIESRAVNQDSWPGGTIFVELILRRAARGRRRTWELPWHRGDRGTGAGGRRSGDATTDAHPDHPRQSRPAGDVLDDLLDLAGLSPETRFVATAQPPSATPRSESCACD